MIKKRKTERESRLSSLVNVYLCLIVAGLPLIVTDGYYNITETKSIFFYSLSIFFVCVFLLQGIFTLIKEKSYLKLSVITLSFTDRAFLLFACFTVLSAFLSPYGEDVWYGEKSRCQGALTVILYTLVYFIASRSFRKTQSFLLWGIVAFSAVALLGVFNCFDADILGFYSSIGAEYKKLYISTIGNVNFYSSYFCLLLPLALCGLCQTKGKLSTAIYGGALVIGSFGMMVTSSESFVLGMAVSLAVMTVLFSTDTEKFRRLLLGIAVMILSSQIFMLIYSRAEKKNVTVSDLLSAFSEPYVCLPMLALVLGLYAFLGKKPLLTKKIRKFIIFFFSVSAAVMLTCFVLSNTVGLGTMDRYLKITESWGTYRGGIWKECLDIYKGFSLKEKLFGIGPEALYRVIQALEVHGNRNLDQAHNEYLQYLLTVGVFGLAAYLLLIGSVIFAVFKKLRNDTLAVGLLSGLIAFWVQAAVNIAQPFTTPIMYIFISVIGGLLYNGKKKEIPPEKVSYINNIPRRKHNGTRN